MDTKTSKAVELWKQGYKVEALAIFKTFKLGFSKEEKDTITIAHEMQTLGSKFYEMLGYDSKEVMQEAICIIEEKYKL